MRALISISLGPYDVSMTSASNTPWFRPRALKKQERKSFNILFPLVFLLLHLPSPFSSSSSSSSSSSHHHHHHHHHHQQHHHHHHHHHHHLKSYLNGGEMQWVDDSNVTVKSDTAQSEGRGRNGQLRSKWTQLAHD
jgi:hypothetical protein